ncbi:MAG: hypothetical protein ASARMPREDX12_008547 [Alectoria sarmentosa]|nr:MAG: hypothetical protein ASARMPREDX12_008547 [Alectoria sarmentosa]
MPTLDGQDDALNELLLAKQWKQALNLCEKKLKKANNSDYLLVKKIKVLLLWPEETRNQQGMKELGVLLERKPPVDDIETLCALDALAEAQGENEPRLRQIWQRAAGVRPQDEKLHMVWFRSKFQVGNLRAAQQASQSWMKLFPNNRDPFFLYVLTMHELAEDSATPEPERTLLRSLAYKFLSKAVAEVPEGLEGIKPTRAINTLEDLLLLVRVYRAQGKYSEAAAIVRDSRTGIESPLGRNSWELVRQLIELLELSHQWLRLWQLCQQLLVDARDNFIERKSHLTHYPFGKLGDDWKVWQALITASSNIGTQERFTFTESLITSFGTGMSRSRNAQLALLKFYSCEAAPGKAFQDELLSSCWEYFKDFSTKVACFHDLQPYIASLERAKQEKLVDLTGDIAREIRPEEESSESKKVLWITSEINVLKLEYNLVISRDDNTFRNGLLQAFICNCLRLYRLSLRYGLNLPVSDRLPGDDAALLAAMGLIRLYKGRQIYPEHNNALLQSIVVLEHLLLRSKHNYDALLILVRLYMFLGAGSLAMERYSQLSIKNLQHATISWVLYTHMSTIHPHPAIKPRTNGGGQVIIDPASDMAQALDWHESALGLSKKAVTSMQGNGLWNISLDALSTSSYIGSGFSKLLLLVETKRIARFLSSSHEIQSLDVMPIPPRTKDARDRLAFPNYEAHGQLSFEETLPLPGPSIVPNVNDKWLQHQLSLAQFWDMLHNNGHSSIDRAGLAVMKQNSGSDPRSFTDAEYTIGVVLTILYELYTVFHQKPPPMEAKPVDAWLRNAVENLEIYIPTGSRTLESNMEAGMNASALLGESLKIPLWSYFHSLYTYLELCKFLTPILDYVLAENRKCKHVDASWLGSKVVIFREEGRKLSANVRLSATDLRDKLRGPVVLQEITREVIRDTNNKSKDVIGTELHLLGNESTKICKNIQESWIEALDGVIRTRVT